jgi:SAM-dependent methyltransferase
MNPIDEKFVRPPPARWSRGTTVAGSAADDSIPCYLALPPVEDATTRDRLARMVELTRGGTPWKEALAATHEPALVRYVTDPMRAAFLDLLPLKPDSEILEIGPGMGQFTALMARRTRRVEALEVVPEQAEFVALRSRQDGAGNIGVAIGGDDCRLPYRDASFDGVVLNLVFEWCGSRLESEPHEVAQARLLAEMVRVLKPGGFLYLTTKNRFALRILLGGADEHMHEMPFGSALPRRLGAWLLKRRGHSRPSGWLYSHDVLLAKLRGAGLGQVRSFWTVPEMRFPTHYVPSDAASVRRARSEPGFRQAEGRKVSLAMRFVPAAWVRHFMPGLAFLAVKERSPA